MHHVVELGLDLLVQVLGRMRQEVALLVHLALVEYDGYEVMLAATGEEGVKLVEREAPDLVFLDIKMPGMDGLEVLQKLRHLVEVTPDRRDLRPRRHQHRGRSDAARRV